MNDGKPAYVYNYFGLKSYTIEAPNAIKNSKAEIKLEFAYDGDGTGKGGLAKLYIDGVLDRTIPLGAPIAPTSIFE